MEGSLTKSAWSFKVCLDNTEDKDRQKVISPDQILSPVFFCMQSRNFPGGINNCLQLYAGQGTIAHAASQYECNGFPLGWTDAIARNSKRSLGLRSLDKFLFRDEKQSAVSIVYVGPMKSRSCTPNLLCFSTMISTLFTSKSKKPPILASCTDLQLVAYLDFHVIMPPAINK